MGNGVNGLRGEPIHVSNKLILINSLFHSFSSSTVIPRKNMGRRTSRFSSLASIHSQVIRRPLLYSRYSLQVAIWRIGFSLRLCTLNSCATEEASDSQSRNPSQQQHRQWGNTVPLPSTTSTDILMRRGNITYLLSYCMLYSFSQGYSLHRLKLYS